MNLLTVDKVKKRILFCFKSASKLLTPGLAHIRCKSRLTLLVPLSMRKILLFCQEARKYEICEFEKKYISSKVSSEIYFGVSRWNPKCFLKMNFLLWNTTYTENSKYTRHTCLLFFYWFKSQCNYSRMLQKRREPLTDQISRRSRLHAIEELFISGSSQETRINLNRLTLTNFVSVC